MNKLLMAVVAAVLSGCAAIGLVRTDLPVQIENEPVMLRDGNTMPEVIKKAAARRNWATAKIEDEDTIRCTLDNRGKKVVVDVHYLDNSFTITYVSSEGLNYNETTGEIHPKYNQWVRNLGKDIVAEARR